MTRNPRWDLPGSWLHVMNRGIARRSLFESRDDIRFFLACLARAVHRGQIEVHAWTILTTHFHLLLRSLTGEISTVMRLVQNAYVRRYYRGRKRDGPLVRGRFVSKPVTTTAYRTVLVRYIDDNPVRAGLVENPCQYPYGSACDYARDSGPPWLSRDWVEGLVCRELGLEHYDGRVYTRGMAAYDREAVREIVDGRIAIPARATPRDDLDDLVGAAPGTVLDWMRYKAELADGSPPGLPVASPTSIRQVIARCRSEQADWTVRTSRKNRSGWEVLEAGLLRDLSACTFSQIAAGSPWSEFTASRLYEQHRELVRADTEYADATARLAREILDGIIRG